MADNAQNASHVSWVETFKEKIDIEKIKNYFSYNNLIQLFFYLAGGVILGVLLKRFGNYFLFTAIFGGIALYLLYQFHVITWDIENLKMMFGLSKADSIGSIIQLSIDWITHNPLLALTALIGFFIGCKLG